eukprot:2289721-Pyramimonas_sp.AAC.1
MSIAIRGASFAIVSGLRRFKRRRDSSWPPKPGQVLSAPERQWGRAKHAMRSCSPVTSANLHQ